MAVEHLVAAGRKRIAHVAGPATERAAIDRAIGMREALDTLGGSLVYEPQYGEWSERWGRSACAMLLEQGIGADAILCDSDQIARGALDALKERAVAVPRDVAVMGFDNWDVIVEGTHPMLTSVDMNLERLGRLAAQRLFEAIDGGTLGSGIEYQPCRLAVRGSTTPDI
jgi:LacI family transcriptional regulator